MSIRQLTTPRGTIAFPTFMPVTTFGGKYPLDDLIRPYLRRFTDCIMVSYHYAKQMKPAERPKLPLFVDSGGFASLFEGSNFIDKGDYAVIETRDGDLIEPQEVLAFQEQHADIGATLDFIVSPGLSESESMQRQDLTIKNALWALRHRKSTDLRLFASVQAWDARSAKRIMASLMDHPFNGFALGGMVPRTRDPQRIVEIVRTLREIEPNRPLHVFGIGSPKLISQLMDAGVDSTDSSSFLQNTALKKYLDKSSKEWVAIDNADDTCKCKVCRAHSTDYLAESGEANNLSLALHNLYMTVSAIRDNFEP